MLVSALLAFTAPQVAHAENDSEPALPNIHGKSLATPTGWGAAYGTVFAGMGGTVPAPFSDNSDAAVGFGVGIGNPVDNLGLQASVVSLDLSDWKRYSLNFKLHRYLGNGNSIAIGVNNIILTDSDTASDASECYYIVYSQAVQDPHVINEDTNISKLHFSVGVGYGEFWENIPSYSSIYRESEREARVFANVSYELFDELNAIAEWDCEFLNAGISKTFMVGPQSALVASVGAGNLTDRYDDGIRFI